MTWVMVAVSLAVLWVASLYKILFRPLASSSKSAFLNESRMKNVLLVIAHPDDESMFFTPTINYLTSRGHIVHILCISTGNAGGIGPIRREELYLASAILKILPHHVKVLDHPDLQIVTFDSFGVSGHCNHRDVHQGVRKSLHEDSQRKVEAWELASTNIFRKYSGAIDIWLSIFLANYQSNPDSQLKCLLNENPRKSYAAMAQHKSQWIWFRKLFVSLSSYTYVNTLKKMK